MSASDLRAPGTGLNRRFATPRAVVALILREMSTRYGRSPGGFIWALLEPLGTILILGVAFSLLIRSPSLGSSFLLFYATGYLPFSLYQNIALYVARAINFSRNLLFYPAVTWVDAVIARFILNAIVGLLVSYIILAGMLAIEDTRGVLDLTSIVVALALAMLVGLGMGVLNCALIGLLDPWELIWSIVTRPLFLASGVLLIYEDLPQTIQAILWYNPLLHVTGYMRMGFYPMYNPNYLSAPFVIGFGLVTLTLGLLLLGRFHRDILNKK